MTEHEGPVVGGCADGTWHRGVGKDAALRAPMSSSEGYAVASNIPVAVQFQEDHYVLEWVTTPESSDLYFWRLDSLSTHVALACMMRKYGGQK